MLLLAVSGKRSYLRQAAVSRSLWQILAVAASGKQFQCASYKCTYPHTYQCEKSESGGFPLEFMIATKMSLKSKSISAKPLAHVTYGSVQIAYESVQIAYGWILIAPKSEVKSKVEAP